MRGQKMRKECAQLARDYVAGMSLLVDRHDRRE